MLYHSNRQRTKHKHFNWVSACCRYWLGFHLLNSSTAAFSLRPKLRLAWPFSWSIWNLKDEAGAYLGAVRWGFEYWQSTTHKLLGFLISGIRGCEPQICNEAELYSCTWSSSSSSDNISFFSEFTELTRDIYIYVWNCSSYVSGSTAYCFCSSWRLCLVFQCLSDRFKALAVLQPLQDLGEFWVPPSPVMC